jgi:osmotically inducible lipoprotein OsmB
VVAKVASRDSKRNGAIRPARKAKSMTSFTRPLAIKFILMTTLLLSATACGNTWGQRAVTGGAIGAGAGAGVGAITGIGVLPGAVVGGVVGAGVGAATTPGG